MSTILRSSGVSFGPTTNLARRELPSAEPKKKIRIGDLLVQNDVITEQQLMTAKSHLNCRPEVSRRDHVHHVQHEQINHEGLRDEALCIAGLPFARVPLLEPLA